MSGISFVVAARVEVQEVSLSSIMPTYLSSLNLAKLELQVKVMFYWVTRFIELQEFSAWPILPIESFGKKSIGMLCTS